MKEKKQKKNFGFTLVEMLVAITLFSIVSTIAFTALYSIMQANSKAKTTKLVVNNLNMAMELMTREIRMGREYCAGEGSPCNDDDVNNITFKNKDGCEVEYRYDNTNQTVRRIIKTSPGCTGSNNNIMGENIIVTKLSFSVRGAGTGDNNQPRVFLLLKGETKRDDIDTIFDIQTTISQRTLAP